MKIAFVNDTFLQGRGADTVIYELARRLGKKNEVYVITSQSDIPEENFKILKINIRKLFTGNSLLDAIFYFPNIIKLRRGLLKLQKNYKFDVFNVHHSSLNLAFRKFLTVVTWHGSPPSTNYIRTIFNRLILFTLSRNPRSIAISKYIASKLPKVINSDKIKIIYNGVSEEFKPKSTKGYTDKNYMLYVGRLEKHKCVSELIRLSKDLNFPLHIIGSGPEEKYLKNYARKIWANKTIFFGKISRSALINQYQECSFFVSASRWEGFGLIFIEAASCGKPSIAYNLCSIPEVVKNNKTGFLVKDYEEFKSKASLLIKNKNLRIEMGKNSLNFSKKFRWEKVCKKYLEEFKKVKDVVKEKA
ncbi:MAG: glycosyltransferase family 4 protein [Candidatus Pacearchaeota archaeon]